MARICVSLSVSCLALILLSVSLTSAAVPANKCGIPGGGLTDLFGLRAQFLKSTPQPSKSTTLSPLDTNKIPDARAGSVASSDRLNTSFISIVDILTGSTSGSALPSGAGTRGSSSIFDDQSVNEPGNGRRRVIPRSLDKRETGRDEVLNKASASVHTAQPNHLCWQVRVTLLTRISTGRYSVSTCGGVIIGPSTILTAAHCLISPFPESSSSKVAPEDISVHTGDPSTSTCNNGTSSPCSAEFTVRNFTIHPAYNPTLGDNDLALVFLNNPINLQNNCSCALCLRNATPAAGETCIVSGTGDDLSMKSWTSSVAPRWTSLTIREASLTTFTCGFNIDDNTGQPTDLDLFVCAGGLPNERSCLGDSGGPLVCYDFLSGSHYVAGVFSFGPPCGVHIGAMYSTVAIYLDWIVANSNGDLILA